MDLKESAQMYLETILILAQKNSIVRSIDIAEYMGFSKPSVSRAMGLLKKNDYLTVSPEGYIVLTKQGAEIANKMYERHRILTELLVSLGVDEQIAAQDACKMEHDISDESFEAVKAHAHKMKRSS